MMTRTCAEDLAINSGIYMNSVDTGWINDENPLPTAQRIAEHHHFQTPIDEIDAAARIVDPVLTGLGVEPIRPKRGAMAGGLTDGPPWGWFLKDYMQTETGQEVDLSKLFFCWFIFENFVVPLEFWSPAFNLLTHPKLENEWWRRTCFTCCALILTYSPRKLTWQIHLYWEILYTVHLQVVVVPLSC